MQQDDRPGQAIALAPGLRRVLAGNPSPMTGPGTNTYLLGEGELAVIDPGPDDPHHLAALLAAIGGARVSHILVTHSHRDHSPLARPLSRATGAPVLAFGDSLAGRSAVMADLAAAGVAGGGEGVDTGFAPDIRLANGAAIAGAGWTLRAIHTPGHFGNHLCLAWAGGIFTGDHVMGWASSLVSPPDGDLTDFMASCRRLRGMANAVGYPGHGDPVADLHARLDWLIGHREAREAQIIAALASGPATVAALTAALYADTPTALHPAAARNVFAHLVDLAQRNLVQATPDLRPTARFGLAGG